MARWRANPLVRDKVLLLLDAGDPQNYAILRFVLSVLEVPNQSTADTLGGACGATRASRYRSRREDSLVVCLDADRWRSGGKMFACAAEKLICLGRHCCAPMFRTIGRRKRTRAFRYISQLSSTSVLALLHPAGLCPCEVQRRP